MLQLRPVMHLMGLLACFLAVLLAVPALTDVVLYDRDWEPFAFVALTTGFVGFGVALAAQPKGCIRLNMRQAFLVTAFGWVIVATIAAAPFMGLGISFTDAFFESMSGITTTGSTVLTHLDQMPTGILLWRAMLQWIGGIGIIAMAILILPLMRIGGM